MVRPPWAGVGGRTKRLWREWDERAAILPPPPPPFSSGGNQAFLRPPLPSKRVQRGKENGRCCSAVFIVVFFAECADILFYHRVFTLAHCTHLDQMCLSQSLFPLEELTTALFNFDLLLDFASIKHAGLLLQLIEDSQGWRAGGYFLFIIVLLLPPPPPPLFRESGAKGRTNKFLRLRLDWAKER